MGVAFLIEIRFTTFIFILSLLASVFASAAFANPAQAMLRVTQGDVLHMRLPWGPLLLHQCERRLKFLTRVKSSGHDLIGSDANNILKGFSGFNAEQFREYNYPQVWVERRMIPQAINGRIPQKNAVVLDLGSGPGTSTEILSFFADPSWRIIGMDVTPEFIAIANGRAARGEFRNKLGQVIPTEFVVQDLSKSLLLSDGRAIPKDSVDFAISAGVVGLYMNSLSVDRLAGELWRSLKPGGYAAIDAGPAVGIREILQIMGRYPFTLVGRAKSFWLFEPRPKLIFRKN